MCVLCLYVPFGIVCVCVCSEHLRVCIISVYAFRLYVRVSYLHVCVFSLHMPFGFVCVSSVSVRVCFASVCAFR